MFSAAEALGLVMAVLDGHHNASDPTDPVGSALGKIMRALPEPVAAQAEAVRRTTAPAPHRAAARPDPGTTTALVQACSNHRRVRLGYRSEAGSWVIEVDPWAVVVRHGRWYLLCWSHTTDARRAYRIDRVRGVEVLDDTFSPPADLDPVAMLEEHLAVGWEYNVEVVIDAPVDTVARCPDTATFPGPDTKPVIATSAIALATYRSPSVPLLVERESLIPIRGIPVGAGVGASGPTRRKLA
jgi:predicted DNA-binding transcriptional regulator YafY